jgi:hypothetical protein
MYTGQYKQDVSSTFDKKLKCNASSIFSDCAIHYFSIHDHAALAWRCDDNIASEEKEKHQEYEEFHVEQLSTIHTPFAVEKEDDQRMCDESLATMLYLEKSNRERRLFTTVSH